MKSVKATLLLALTVLGTCYLSACGSDKPTATQTESPAVDQPDGDDDSDSTQVNIGNGTVHVKSADGTEVNVDAGGVHVTDSTGKTDVQVTPHKVKAGKVNVNF